MVRLLLLLVLVTLFGCHGELHEIPGNLHVRVGLASDGSLHIVDAAPVGELPNPPVGDEALRFTFRPADGGPVVEGAVRDDRVLRSEFDELGQLDPQTVIAGAAVFDVRVPAVAGRLELHTADGTLGAVEVDPMRRTRTQALMRESDVLGRPVKVVDHGDSSRKADILFLPEGYTERELPQFHAHVQSIVEQLATHSGYRDHWDGFNIWRQDVRSRTSGTGRYGLPIDTAFETASGVSGVERCVFFTNPGGIGAARSLALEAGADATVILVNSTSHGGCAGAGFVVAARPRGVADVVGHELGHALFGLADEYETTRPGGHCTVGPNVAVASRLEALPWADMVNTRELPTSPNAPFGTIGAFQGAGYCPVGRYRPTHNCMMRNLGVGMCPVCRREMARTMAALAPASPEDDHAIAVTNETGAGLWVRCDGAPRSTCSDWTWLADGATETVRSPDGALTLHNRDAGAAVTFDLERVTVTSDAVTVYANAADPFRAAASTVGTPIVAAPTGLSPDLTTVRQADVVLTWAPVAGATRYDVRLEAENAGAWTAYDAHSVAVPQLAVTLDPGHRRYRWQVIACGERSCAASLQAIFTAELAAHTAVAAPSVPTLVSPANEAVVNGTSLALDWSGDAGSYNVAVQVYDDAAGRWVDHAARNAHPDSALTLSVTRSGTWYAWAVQACNERGCSAWSPQSMVYVQP